MRSTSRGTRWQQHLFDPHGLDLIREIFPEDPVELAQQFAGCDVPGKDSPESLSGPLRAEVGGHGDVEDPAEGVDTENKSAESMVLR